MARSESFFYHHTNGPALEAILKTHKLRASTDITQDAKCGEGVYVTEKTPDHHTDEQLLFNNFGNGFPGKTVKDTWYYIKLSRSSLGKRKIVDGAKDGRNRYAIVGGNLELKNMDFSVGKRKNGNIIREMMVEEMPNVVSWLEDELRQGMDEDVDSFVICSAATYSCVSCHQPIDPNQCGIRLRDRASGVHAQCWDRVFFALGDATCLLCQTTVHGLCWKLRNGDRVHNSCLSKTYDSECSTLICKYCNSPAPVRLDRSALLADCHRAECRNKANNEQVNKLQEQHMKLLEQHMKLLEQQE